MFVWMGTEYKLVILYSNPPILTSTLRSAGYIYRGMTKVGFKDAR